MAENKRRNNNLGRNDAASEERNLESAQENQESVGNAARNPETTGPAENVREKAAEMNDETEGSEEPA